MVKLIIFYRIYIDTFKGIPVNITWLFYPVNSKINSYHKNTSTMKKRSKDHWNDGNVQSPSRGTLLPVPMGPHGVTGRGENLGARLGNVFTS